MGVLHLEHMGGRKMYFCASCDTNLTNKDQLVSKKFKCSSGRAILFKKVVNVDHGQAVVRKLLTGEHVVKNVYCKKCGVKLGWFYEFAWNDQERYKEGKTLLEEQMIYEQVNEAEN